MYGFADGTRVRDTRSGYTGTVRHLVLTDEERASGEYAQAEICWDATDVADELDENSAQHLIEER